MDDTVTIETEMFGHREVKPHFINLSLLRRGSRGLAETVVKVSDDARLDVGKA